MPKRSLRRQLLTRRRALGYDEWSASSRSAQLNLILLEEFSRSRSVALYAPVHNETDTGALLEVALADGKQVLYPVTCGHDMVFHQVNNPDELRKGRFGIPEPCPADSGCAADNADLIVVPGVAFDLNGHRIGYGKGFYDRFLEHAAPLAHLVGLCHDFQLIEEGLPADSHDIRMDIVVTDKRIIYHKK